LPCAAATDWSSSPLTSTTDTLAQAAADLEAGDQAGQVAPVPIAQVARFDHRRVGGLIGGQLDLASALGLEQDRARRTRPANSLSVGCRYVVGEHP